MAYVIDEFKDFAMATNREISQQVCEAFEQEMYDDLQELVRRWSETIGQRIDARLEEVGLDSDFYVTIRLNDPHPIIEIIGKVEAEEEEKYG
jgi:hypothetical protein